MKQEIVLATFILLLSISCAPTKTTTKGSYIKLSPDITKGSISEKKPEEIKIFYKKIPDFKFIEIGIVEAIARGKDAGLKDLFPELKKQAAEIGSDAVYKIELQRYNQTGDGLHATGIAIIKK